MAEKSEFIKSDNFKDNSGSNNTDFRMKWYLFTELNVHQLYELLALRSDVFVVEQNCVFLDLDNTDQDAQHLLGFEGEQIVTYCRCYAPKHKYDEYSSIGRVVTHSEYRSRGLGKRLLQEAIYKLTSLYPTNQIKIGAQSHLGKFYGPKGLGFENFGDEYDEDGIPHIDMLYKKHLE